MREKKSRVEFRAEFVSAVSVRLCAQYRVVGGGVGEREDEVVDDFGREKQCCARLDR